MSGTSFHFAGSIQTQLLQFQWSKGNRGNKQASASIWYVCWRFAKCQLKDKTAAEIEQGVLIELMPCPNDKARQCTDILPNDTNNTEDSKTNSF